MQSYESDMRTYSQMQSDPNVPEDERQRRLIDEALGLTAHLLLQRDFRDEADTMLRIVDTEIDSYYDFGQDHVMLRGLYEPGDAERFKKHGERISEMFREVCNRKGYADGELCGSLDFQEVLPEITYGWREQLAEILHGKKRTNQARIVREEHPRWAEDGLYFTNMTELKVYRALKKMQEDDFPRDDAIAIFPLPRGRIPGYTREPDFIVTYKGRTGILEVDGPVHNGRRSHDVSSEHLYRDAGVSFVDRLSVEATNDPAELRASLQRFIRRLRDPR